MDNSVKNGLSDSSDGSDSKLRNYSNGPLTVFLVQKRGFGRFGHFCRKVILYAFRFDVRRDVDLDTKNEAD